MPITFAEFCAAHPVEDTLEDRLLRAEIALSFDIAQLVYDMRTQAGVSQKKLAKWLNTTKSAIENIESGGHKLDIALVVRAARALGFRIQLSAEPIEATPSSAMR